MKLSRLKTELLSCIKNVSMSPMDIAVDPDRHFTRNRKLPLFEVIRCIVVMGGNSIKQELLDIR